MLKENNHLEILKYFLEHWFLHSQYVMLFAYTMWNERFQSDKIQPQQMYTLKNMVVVVSL